MTAIPINNRRWSSLAVTTPSVVPDTSGLGLASVRGVSMVLNNVEIHGADDNQAYYAEERGRLGEAYSTSSSAVREFAGEHGGVLGPVWARSGRSDHTRATKSGTNTLHGTAYGYDRESNWAAYNDYTKRLELNPGTGLYTQQHIKPEDLRKIYGFTVGGALVGQEQAFLDLHLRSAYPRLPGYRHPQQSQRFLRRCPRHRAFLQA